MLEPSCARPCPPGRRGTDAWSWPPPRDTDRSTQCRPGVLAFLEPTVKLNDNAIRVVDIKAAHPPLRVGERLPRTAKRDPLGQELVQQRLRIGHGKGEVRDPQLIQLQRRASDLLTH